MRDDTDTEVIYTTAQSPETVAVFYEGINPDKFKRKSTPLAAT